MLLAGAVCLASILYQGDRTSGAVSLEETDRWAYNLDSFERRNLADDGRRLQTYYYTTYDGNKLDITIVLLPIIVLLVCCCCCCCGVYCCIK